MLKKELHIHDDDEIFWTDSKVVVSSRYLLQIESSR